MNDIYTLKIDEKLFHHYIFSVKAKPAICHDAGNLYLKHGPIHFTNDDIRRVQGAALLSQDKLFRTKQDQAVKNFECGELVHNLWALKLSANANECTIHHFSSEYEVDSDFFISFVENANRIKSNREMLKKARI
jgi:hypothetical protein